MPRQTTAVTRRLRSLAVLELINVGIIGWAAFGPFSADTSPTNLAAYGLVAAHLVVGSAYWAAKVHQLHHGDGLPVKAHLLVPVRRVLVIGLAIGLVIIVASVPSQPPSSWLAAVPLWLLAAAEHVNYFHWQLMYDNRADLRRLLSSGLVRPHAREDALAGAADPVSAPRRSGARRPSS